MDNKTTNTNVNADNMQKIIDYSVNSMEQMKTAVASFESKMERIAVALEKMNETAYVMLEKLNK